MWVVGVVGVVACGLVIAAIVAVVWVIAENRKA
jgi:hypothetical protein